MAAVFAPMSSGWARRNGHACTHRKHGTRFHMSCAPGTIIPLTGALTTGGPVTLKRGNMANMGTLHESRA